MTKNEDTIDLIFREHLDGCGVDGSTFKSAYDACADKLPPLIDVARAQRKRAHDVWLKMDKVEITRTGEMPPVQYVLNGFVCESILRFKDGVEPDPITVLYVHAVVHQYEKYCDYNGAITDGHVDKQRVRTDNLAALRELSDGDMFARLIDLVSVMEDEPTG